MFSHRSLLAYAAPVAAVLVLTGCDASPSTYGTPDVAEGYTETMSAGTSIDADEEDTPASRCRVVSETPTAVYFDCRRVDVSDCNAGNPAAYPISLQEYIETQDTNPGFKESIAVLCNGYTSGFVAHFNR